MHQRPAIHAEIVELSSGVLDRFDVQQVVHEVGERALGPRFEPRGRHHLVDRRRDPRTPARLPSNRVKSWLRRARTRAAAGFDDRIVAAAPLAAGTPARWPGTPCGSPHGRTTDVFGPAAERQATTPAGRPANATHPLAARPQVAPRGAQQVTIGRRQGGQQAPLLGVGSARGAARRQRRPLAVGQSESSWTGAGRVPSAIPRTITRSRSRPTAKDRGPTSTPSPNRPARPRSASSSSSSVRRNTSSDGGSSMPSSEASRSRAASTRSAARCSSGGHSACRPASPSRRAARPRPPRPACSRAGARPRRRPGRR